MNRSQERYEERRWIVPSASLCLLGIASTFLIFSVQNLLRANDMRAAVFAAEAQRLNSEGLHAEAALMALSGDPAARHLGPLQMFRPEGNVRATEALDQAMRKNLLLRTIEVGDLMVSMGIPPDSRHTLVAGYPTGRISEISLEQGWHRRDLDAHQGRVNSIVFHPDGQRFLTTSADGVIRLWQLGKNQPLQEFKGHQGWVYSAIFHPDGLHILSASADRTAKLWRLGQAEPLQTFEGHDAGVWSLAAHPDGRRFATGSDDSTIKIWEIGEDLPLQTLSGRMSWVSSLAFNREGTHVLAGSTDGNVALWKLGANGSEQVFSGHGDEVLSVAFHPAGDKIASASRDGTAKVWKIGSSTPEATMAGHTSLVHSVFFLSGGKQLMTGSWDGRVKLWQLQPAGLDDEEGTLARNDPAQVADVACRQLKKIGVPAFSESDRERWPFLQSESLDPCTFFVPARH